MKVMVEFSINLPWPNDSFGVIAEVVSDGKSDQTIAQEAVTTAREDPRLERFLTMVRPEGEPLADKYKVGASVFSLFS